MDPRRPCSHAPFWIALSILGVFLFVSAIMNMGFMFSLAAKSGSAPHRGQGGEDEFPQLVEKWSFGSGDVKAVRIPIHGALFREAEEGLFRIRYDKIEAVIRQIRAAKNDEDVKALIVEVSSPGGDITSADEIYKALLDFKESDADRKVVGFVRDMAASGGYYILAPADWIVSEPTAILGSIGVIMQTLNWKGFSEKIGITDTTIKAGANKDLLNPFHDVSSNQVAILQTMVNSMYDRFFDIVQASRKIDDAKLKSIADGRIFDADFALEANFVDQIGYWDDAMAKTAELVGEKSVKVVRYEVKMSFFDTLASAQAPLSLSRFVELGIPRFLYLWKP